MSFLVSLLRASFLAPCPSLIWLVSRRCGCPSFGVLRLLVPSGHWLAPFLSLSPTFCLVLSYHLLLYQPFIPSSSYSVQKHFKKKKEGRASFPLQPSVVVLKVYVVVRTTKCILSVRYLVGLASIIASAAAGAVAA